MKWRKMINTSRPMYTSEDGRFKIDHDGCNQFTLYDHNYNPGEDGYWYETGTYKAAKSLAEKIMGEE